MHVGHLRSTIIGDSLARVLEFCDHKVQRINHVGDWGTQFGIIIAYLKEIDNTPDTIEKLHEIYKLSKKKADTDSVFKEKAKLEVVKLQSGDETNLKLWRHICQISREQFQKIYDKLDIKLIERGESFYNAFLPNIVKELTELKIATETDKAICVLHKDFPLIIQKSDGGYTYDTTDLAGIKYRLTVENADWLIYVTDSGQYEHFKRIFETAKQAGWLKDQRVDHVGFGLMLDAKKKKFKSRDGEAIKLIKLLDEAGEKCLKQYLEKDADTSPDILKQRAETMGYNAIKYADLKKDRIFDCQFSYETMLALKGDTAVYIMYNYARLQNIMQKSGVIISDIKDNITITHEIETQIMLHVIKFHDVILLVLKELKPHYLCKFIYELCGILNVFCEKCRVNGDVNQNSRLLICRVCSMIIKKTMDLLGIKLLDKI